MRGAPHPAKWQEVSRRLQSNAARPALTWHSRLGTRSISKRETKAEIRTYVEEEGCVVWYFWNWISDFTRARLASATRKQSLLIFRTTESDHCVQGQAGWPGRNMWSGQTAWSPHPALAVKTKTPSLSQPALKSLPTLLSLPHLDIIIQSKNYQPSVW